MRTDVASRIVAASPDEVYAALVKPGALVAWLPPSGMSASFEHVDMRSGGSYRMVLGYLEGSPSQGKTTEDSDVVEARVLELVQGVRVVTAIDFVSEDLAYKETMTMTWEITSIEEGRRVEMRAEHVPEVISSADHELGMAQSLANYLEERDPLLA